MVLDLVYGPSRTSFLRAADQAGARGVDGLSMLLYQGARSFELWFQREAPIDVMRKVLGTGD
jgi:shikimate 5-dehydrogenase